MLSLHEVNKTYVQMVWRVLQLARFIPPYSELYYIWYWETYVEICHEF